MAVIILSAAAAGYAAEYQAARPDKHETLRQVGCKWMQIGDKQYQRALYKCARKSLAEAEECRPYLVDYEKERLNRLLEKTEQARIERSRIRAHIQRAKQLIEQDKPILARKHFQDIKGSSFLTEQERRLVDTQLGQDSEISRRQKETSAIYNDSVRLYRNGKLEKARQGFVKIVGSGFSADDETMTAEDYLAKIDGILLRRAELSLTSGIESARPTEGKPQSRFEISPDELLSVAGEEPADAKMETAAGKAETRRNRLRISYINAVINNAEENIHNYIAAGKYKQANAVIASAERTLIKNKNYLSDMLCEQYSQQLKQLSKCLADAEKTKSYGN